MSSFFDLAISFIPFLLVVLVIWLLVRPTLLRRFVSGIREKYTYRTEQPVSRDRPIRRFALPYVAGLWCVFVLAGIALGTPALSAEDLQHYRLYRILLTMPCLIAAVFVHLRPNHSRELKYILNRQRPISRRLEAGCWRPLGSLLRSSRHVGVDQFRADR
jgi:hypothetical protein